MNRLETRTIALEGDRSLCAVFWSKDDECFAQVPGLCVSFNLSADGFRGYLSKLKVTTVKNEELKKALGLGGKVRFLNRDGLTAVLEDRVKDKAVLSAAKAALMSVPAVAAPMQEEHQEVPSASTEKSVEIADEPPSPPPVIIHPRPVPVKVNDAIEVPKAVGPVAQELSLPIGDAWYNSDDYSVGKSYVLPLFDRGSILLEQLRLFREFWTAERVPARRSEALSLVTFDKRESRVLLYLGFLRLIKALDEPKRLTLNACLNHRAVHAFVDWLGKGRESSEGNLIEYLSAFVSVAKFLYRDVSVEITGENCDRVEIVQRLRETRNRFQTKQSRANKTEDDLRDDGKWLSWATFEEAIVSLQSQFDELIREEESPTKSSSRVLHDLLMLRYYAASPSRSGEVRLLQFIPFEDVVQLKGKLSVSRYVERERINVLSKRPLGAWTVWLGNYKTFKSRGVDEANFTEELFSGLNDALNMYLLQGYRKCLIEAEAHNFVFVNCRGACFESSSFSKYLSTLLFKLTGSKPTSNILRSSFVVNMLQSEEGNSAAIRASAASLMHHSQHQQSKVYDRRNPADRKRVAQSFIGKRDRDLDVVEEKASSKTVNTRFSRGDLVVVPYVDNVTHEPKFWFCKVMSDDGVEVGLMELSAIQGGGYRATLQSVWKEPTSAVFHVDAQLNRESGLYELISGQKEIFELLKK